MEGQGIRKGVEAEERSSGDRGAGTEGQPAGSTSPATRPVQWIGSADRTRAAVASAQSTITRAAAKSPKVTVLPVDPDWKCQRSGDCCRLVDGVIMHEKEQEALLEYARKHLTIGRLNRLDFTPTGNGMVEMKAGPCPMLDFDGGVAVCLVHPVRPYNCRRFGCLRPDVKSERLMMTPHAPVLQFGNIGCINLRIRLQQSRVARRIYTLLQRHGQRWARTHGWQE